MKRFFFIFLTLIFGLNSFASMVFSTPAALSNENQIRQLSIEIDSLVAAKDSLVIQKSQKIREYMTSSGEMSLYYASYVNECKYYLSIPSNKRVLSQLRMALHQMEFDLNNLYDSKDGWADYYYLKARQAFISSYYYPAIQNAEKALNLNDNHFDNTTLSSIYLHIAKSNYGLLQCEESVKAAEKAKSFTTQAKTLSNIYGTECLGYGYLEDKDSFERVYDSFKNNPSGVFVNDSIFIEAYHEAFTKGTYDREVYAKMLPEIKAVKLDYLINKVLGKQDTSLSSLEEFNNLLKLDESEQMDDFSEVYNMEIAAKRLENENYRIKQSANAIIIISIILVLFVTVITILILKYKNKQLLEANSIKTKFVQNMSHEIRTPLNAIVGFAQILALPPDFLTNEEREKYSSFVTGNSQLLTMLIDDILTVSDVEHGNLNINISEFNVNEICVQAIQNCLPRCKPGVSMDYIKTLPDQFIIKNDPNRILQVIINFLTNACKNTESGSITLECKESGENMSFSVTDTGCGVPKEKRDKIFDRFTKLDSFKQGSGLGLSICKMISERLGGYVRLDTEYEKGARFELVVPKDCKSPSKGVIKS